MNPVELVNTLLAPVAAENVVYKAMPDGAVLFSSDSEVYFGLNAVGARVWELLLASDTVAQITEAMAMQYPEVPADVIQSDVGELLAELERQGLVRAREGGADQAVAFPNPSSGR